MPRYSNFLAGFTGIFMIMAVGPVAIAHPHGPDEEVAENEATTVKKRGVIRIRTDEDGENVEREFRWSGEDFPQALENLKSDLMDSDILNDLTESVNEFAAKIEIERSDGKGTAFFFDHEEMLRFKRDRDAHDDDRISISGLGRNLTLDRETIVEDGQTRTRIVIEMDGGEEVEIDLPDAPQPPKAPSSPEELQ